MEARMRANQSNPTLNPDVNEEVFRPPVFKRNQANSRPLGVENTVQAEKQSQIKRILAAGSRCYNSTILLFTQVL